MRVVEEESIVSNECIRRRSIVKAFEVRNEEMTANLHAYAGRQ